MKPSFELYDLSEDPYEQHDVASKRPEVLADLTRQYNAWFDDIIAEHKDIGMPPAIHLGAPQAPWVQLTRQDWKREGRGHGWQKNSRGYWEVDVKKAGPYEVTVHFLKGTKPTRLELSLGSLRLEAETEASDRSHTFHKVRLPPGRGQFRVLVHDAKATRGAYQVRIAESGSR